MKYSFLLCAFGLTLFFSCRNSSDGFDAAGNFEADEVIVSAQQTGQLLSFSIEEGDSIPKGRVVGQIDVIIAKLQMEQAKANITALQSKTRSSADQNELVKKQLAVQEAELEHQL